MWKEYTDVDNEIIEDAYSEKNNNIEIDGNYIIDFKQLIQKEGNTNKECPIKRVQSDRDRSSVNLHEQRFSSPVTITSSTFPTATSNRNDNDWYNASFSDYEREIKRKNTLLVDVIEAAAQGILKEGTVVNETKRAQWLAECLWKVKGFGTNVKADRIVKFTAFTSTSANRQLAGMYGDNTLLFFYLEFELGYGIKMNAAVGANISGLSYFPQEEEYLIYPGTRFHFARNEFDSDKNIYIVHLRSWFDK